MSRLDSFIARMQAQRDCLNFLKPAIDRLGGPIFEVGLGNGRTYDHLRSLFPGREIYVCERAVAAHPDCVPPAERLILGDMRDTLPILRARLGGQVALAHLDAGSGDAEANRGLAAALTPLLMPLLCQGAVLVSDPTIENPGLAALPLPDGIAPGRYHLYRRV